MTFWRSPLRSLSLDDLFYDSSTFLEFVIHFSVPLIQPIFLLREGFALSVGKQNEKSPRLSVLSRFHLCLCFSFSFLQSSDIRYVKLIRTEKIGYAITLSAALSSHRRKNVRCRRRQKATTTTGTTTINGIARRSRSASSRQILFHVLDAIR